jgi:hypothetical protein
MYEPIAGYQEINGGEIFPIIEEMPEALLYGPYCP